MPISGATVDGKKPIPSLQIHDYGVRGGAKEAAPSGPQVAGEGAGPGDGSGKHIATPAPSTPPLNSPAADAERISTGTTAEEQKKRLAARMYPSSRGLGEYGAPAGL